MKRTVISVTLVVALMGASALIIVSARAARLFDDPVVIEPEERLPLVGVRVLDEGRVEEYLHLTGTVQPWEHVTQSAEVSGKIEWLGVDEGDVVAKGDPLVRVNTKSLQAEFDRLEAEYTLADQEFERERRQSNQGISSSQAYDRAEAQRNAARAALRVTEIELAKSETRAQFEGVVDQVHNEAGEFVTMGTPLVRLVQVERVKVVVGLPERDVVAFERGDSVTIQFDAWPERTFTGTLHRIATTADAATRTFPTEIEVSNPDGLLRPGMIARVRLVKTAYPSGIAIPMFSVLTRPEGRFVFVESDGEALMRPVRLGFFQDGQVHVLKGLEDGDRLIVAGHRSLRDGDRVRAEEVFELP